MASFNIPASPSKYTMVVDTFRGVDLINSPTNVEKSRSPAAPNMIRDQVGKVRKRMGYRTVATAPEGPGSTASTFWGRSGSSTPGPSSTAGRTGRPGRSSRSWGPWRTRAA